MYHAKVDVSELPLKKLFLKLNAFAKARKEEAKFQAAIAGATLK